MYILDISETFIGNLIDVMGGIIMDLMPFVLIIAGVQLAILIIRGVLNKED